MTTFFPFTSSWVVKSFAVLRQTSGKSGKTKESSSLSLSLARVIVLALICSWQWREHKWQDRRVGFFCFLRNDCFEFVNALYKTEPRRASTREHKVKGAPKEVFETPSTTRKRRRKSPCVGTSEKAVDPFKFQCVWNPGGGLGPLGFLGARFSSKTNA